MDYREFYQQLGNLLYSIAAVDGTIRESEIKKVKDIVKSKLVPIEGTLDEFGTDAAYLTEFRFDFCVSEKIDPKEAFAEFKSFFRDNSKQIGDAYRDLIFRIAAGVAASFNGFNKTELVFLEDLKKELLFDENL
jgi:hypothetical protein